MQSVGSTIVSVPRRRFVILLAAGVIASAINDGTAQVDPWREFRRDDLGFRIEFPGDPTIEEEKGLPRENLVHSLDAKVEFENISLGIGYGAFKSVPTEEFIRGFRTLSAMGDPITENMLTANGFPAREFIKARGIGDDAYFRIIFMENAIITVQAIGGPLTNPTVRRFLDSFRLLKNAK